MLSLDDLIARTSFTLGLITLTFLWIAVAACIWPPDTVSELVAIPIGALFAFTSVRANLPGAPDNFGMNSICSF